MISGVRSNHVNGSHRVSRRYHVVLNPGRRLRLTSKSRIGNLLFLHAIIPVSGTITFNLKVWL